MPRADAIDRGLELLARRVADAAESVARVPESFEALLTRPARLPRCLVTTGIGTSEGHARHLAEVASRWLGQPARFATTGSLSRGVPRDARRDWLVVFSQGLSANARHAFRDLERWGGVVLVTGLADAESEPGDEALRWLRDLEARGVVRVDMGCGIERGLLLRVIGARVGYAVAWSLLRSLARRRLESAEALAIDSTRLLEAQNAAAREARRAFRDAAAAGAFFAGNRMLLLVSDGGGLELAEQLSLKIAEGMLRAQPRCVDVLHFAHGPLQSLASGPLSILYLAHDPPEAVAGEPDWTRRLAATLDPARHTLRVLRASLPLPFAVLEWEAMLDEWVLQTLEVGDANLVDWPGQDREGALYTASPTPELSPPAHASIDAQPPLRFEESVWPEIEAGIEAGRRTALVALGSIEQHGPHLPLGTDRWIAQALADGLAARLDDAVALPALALGCASEHLDFPGTLHVAPQTLEAVLRDLMGSLRLHGFESAFVFTAHGGNVDALDAMRGRLADAVPAFRVHVETALSVSEMQARAVASEGLAAESAGPHAGEYETSLVAMLRPGRVRSLALRAGRIVAEGDGQSLFYPSLRPHAEEGVLGDPSRASAARGERYLAAWLDLLESAYAGAFAGASSGRTQKKRQ